MTEAAQWRFRWLLETERQVQALVRIVSRLNRRLRAERRADGETYAPTAVVLCNEDNALAGMGGSIRLEVITADVSAVEALCAERYLVRGMLRDLRSARQSVADGQTIDRDTESIQDAMGWDAELARTVALCVRRGRTAQGEPLSTELTEALDAFAAFLTADRAACTVASEGAEECSQPGDVKPAESSEEAEAEVEDPNVSCFLCRVSRGGGFRARFLRARRRLGWDVGLRTTVCIGSLPCGECIVPGYLLVGVVALNPSRRTALLRLLRAAKAVPVDGLQLLWTGAQQRL